MKVLKIPREEFEKIQHPAKFDDLAAKDFASLGVLERREIQRENGFAMVYRGEHGIVEGLACLHIQGW